MILKFYWEIFIFLFLTFRFPVFLLLDVRGCNDDVISLILTLIYRSINNLCKKITTASFVRSGIPYSSGYR